MFRAAWLLPVVLAVGGCASEPLYQLKPVSPASRTLQHLAVARREPGDVNVIASFDRAWEDWLIFRVTVANRTDTVVALDPREFAAAVAPTIWEFPPDAAFRLRPEEPEALHERLDRLVAGEESKYATGQVLRFVGSVLELVADVAGDDPAPPAPEDHGDGPGPAERHEHRLDALSDFEGYLAANLLRPSRLRPWSSADGLIALPAQPVRDAIAKRRPRPAPSGPATMQALESDCAVVLRMPPGFTPRHAIFAVRRF